ncbi:MAG: C-GCAxxG-C-C family protein [Gammaproteobacteria bacterium]|nr:C-GCAxxG-C-C family protein [Gammaproteobacteria bacterium]
MALGAGLTASVGVKPANAATTADLRGNDHTWLYRRLDPVTAANRAFRDYLDGHCMYGVFNSIIGELADQYGEPYSTFPTAMFTYGKAGVVDWATLCGSLNGAAAAISLLSKDSDPAITELFRWHETVALPDFRPADATYEDLGSSIAGSPLCHVSIVAWCEETGFKSFSKERSERCGWVTASVAKKTVEILNAQLDATFSAAHPFSDSKNECVACHGKGGVIENARGEMECMTCHGLGDRGNLRETHPTKLKF